MPHFVKYYFLLLGCAFVGLVGGHSFGIEFPGMEHVSINKFGGNRSEYAKLLAAPAIAIWVTNSAYLQRAPKYAWSAVVSLGMLMLPIVYSYVLSLCVIVFHGLIIYTRPQEQARSWRSLLSRNIKLSNKMPTASKLNSDRPGVSGVINKSVTRPIENNSLSDKKEDTMHYVFERVAQDDIQPYGLDKKIKGVLYAPGPGRRWVVDRAARSYLRCIGSDHEIGYNSRYWDFLWEGFLISLVEKPVAAGFFNGLYINHRKIIKFDLPAELETRRREVQSGIYEAFAVTVRGNLEYFGTTDGDNLPPEPQSVVIKVDFPDGESYGV